MNNILEQEHAETSSRGSPTKDTTIGNQQTSTMEQGSSIAQITYGGNTFDSIVQQPV